MNKGEATREQIISKSARLFNERGFSGASMADIMTATGLKKGGIYNHFASKDEIALAAFDHNWSLLQDEYQRVLKEAGDSPHAQLHSAIAAHASIVVHPAMSGGCPLLNTATENDDGHLQLRERVQSAFDFWQELLLDIVSRGIALGEFKPTIDPQSVATIIISTLEGGIMLTKLYQNPDYIRTATEHLHGYINTNVVN